MSAPTLEQARPQGIPTVALTVGPSTEAGSDTITNLASVASLDQTDVNPQTDSVSVSTSVIREINLEVDVTESREKNAHQRPRRARARAPCARR